MHPAQSRRLRHEKAQAEQTPFPVKRNGRTIGTVTPLKSGRAGLTMADSGFRGSFPTPLDAELRAVAIVKAAEKASS